MATKTPLAEYAGTFRVMASGDTIPAAIVPTLNQNTTGNAATASRVPFFDTRAVNDQPSAIPSKSASYAFKNVGSVDNPPVAAGHGFAHIGNYSGWDSGGVNSGGFNTQVSYGDGLAVRQATSTTTWGPWRKVWHDGNFDPVNGVGASGTWGISITGSAATLATARTLTIGSTGKSFNGSANVSWSLAEIGAIADAPSDGTTYGRKDGAWVAAGGAKVTGTTITGTSNTLGSGNLNTLVEYVGTNFNSGVYIPTGLGTHADIINILNAHPYAYDLYLYPQSGVTLYKGGSSVSSVIIKANTLVSIVRMSATNKWLVM